jgi:hypothetical protein
MNDKSKKILQERYEKLPSGLRAVLKDVNLPTRIQNIIKKHGLRVDQGGAFEDEVMLVLLGLGHPDDFIASLMHKVTLPLDVVEKLVVDTENEIFHPVRESLMKMFPASGHTPPVETTPVAPAVQTNVQPVIQSTPQQQVGMSVASSVSPASITRTLPKDIAQTKLEQSFRIPASVTTIKETSSAPVVPKAVDPYREPVE